MVWDSSCPPESNLTRGSDRLAWGTPIGNQCSTGGFRSSPLQAKLRTKSALFQEVADFKRRVVAVYDDSLPLHCHVNNRRPRVIAGDGHRRGAEHCWIFAPGVSTT